MEELICGEPLGPRVTEVIPKDGYKLIITFDNGEKRSFDATKLLEMKVFAPLKNPAFFNSVRAEYGTVVWPQDIDYCPDTLYSQSVPVSKMNERK